MTKVYLESVNSDWATKRIVNALKKYAPENIEEVDSKEKADLIIFYVNGRLEHIKTEAEKCLLNNKRYAIVQFCLRSTKNPHASNWVSLWEKASVVWSYYDLFSLCDEDKVPHNFNFYYSPLGVDEVFKKINLKKKYVIATNGHGYTTESARECILAAIEVKKRVFHVGPVITNRPEVDFANGISDKELAKKYNECEFVSGLRRIEGFEFPVLEGLVSGARPIVFDKPHYRKWFNDFAIFIPEDARQEVINNLVKIFKNGSKPVTQKEIIEAKKRFNWERIAKGFWTLCLK